MFYKLPKKLLTDEKFSKLSIPAILLYSILHDRVSLSVKKGICDSDGTPYIFFSRKDMAKLLRVSDCSAKRYVSELKKAGLISFGSKEGCTSPPIYVKELLQNKKPVSLPIQAKSYDDDEISEAILKHIMADL